MKINKKVNINIINPHKKFIVNLKLNYLNIYVSFENIDHQPLKFTKDMYKEFMFLK